MTHAYTPHHVVQDAVSSTTHGSGITINLPKEIHKKTRTYKRPVRKLESNRDHLAADVWELRKLLKDADYDSHVVNEKMKELIGRNKELGGFEK